MSVFVIGNVLVDIQVKVADSTIFEKYSLIPNEVQVIFTPDDPQAALFPAILAEEEMTWTSGGSEVNTAKMINHVMAAQGKPGQVLLFGGAGDDNYAAMIEKELSSDGISTYFHKDTEIGQTGMCVTIVHNKKRTICAHLLSAKKYAIAHLNAHEQQLKAARLIYLTSFFISSSFEAMMQIVKYGLEAQDVPIAFNFTHGVVFDFYADEIRQLYPFLDVVFCNKDEADKWSHFRGLGSQSRQDICKDMVLHDKANPNKPRMVVITQGKDPVILGVQHGKEVEVTEYPVEAIEDENISDNYGAGDAFTGGFLSQLAQGRDP